MKSEKFKTFLKKNYWPLEISLWSAYVEVSNPEYCVLYVVVY